MKNNRGQALIELIVFLPLLVTLYSVISGFASSINGSINQQKVTRAYFYYRIQNNSNIPAPQSGAEENGWSQFGMFYIGWKERFEGENLPVMPCYKINIPFKNEPTDKCEDKYDVQQTTFVRVGTVYGICGATYVNQNNVISMVPDNTDGQDYNLVSERRSCTIVQ